MSFIEEFFADWSYDIGCSSDIVEIDKRDYLKKYIKGEFANEN